MTSPAAAIRCPLATCGRENSLPVALCSGCGADLRAFAFASRLNDYYFNRALSQARGGNLASAKRQLRICLALQPRDEEAQLLLGRVQWALGEKKSAVAQWRRLLATSVDESITQQATSCLSVSLVVPAKGTGGRRKGGRK